MNRLFMTAFAASLLATASTAVHSQESANLADQGQNCEALASLIAENPDHLRSEWVEEANQVTQTADNNRCSEYYQQARTALDNRDRGVQSEDAEAAAQIIVTQPDAEVNVQQPAPEVSVTQGQPEVSVNQGRPDVLVRQTPPVVRVQVPQPIITIDQPPPEIIITMPEPDVDVTTPEPQVEVRQAQPQVSVEQGEPQVQVQAQPETGSNGEANVQVQQADPQVTQQQAQGQPRVSVQQQEPNIRYEAAQPDVQVEQHGEPEIRFTESGQPNIQVRREGEQQQAPGENRGTQEQQAQQQSQQQSQQQQAQQPQTAEQAATAEERNAALIAGNESVEAGQPRAYSVSDVVGRPISNVQGQELGTVDRVVVANGRHYVVLARGGFLGLGEEEVALPLDAISVVQGRMLMRGMTSEDIDAMPQFDASNAQVVGTDQQVEIATP